MLIALRSRFLILSTLVVALSFALACASPPVSVVMVLPLAFSLVAGPRFSTERGAEFVINFVALVVGVIVPRALHAGAGPLDEAHLTDRALLFTAPLLLVASVRSLVKNPTYGARGTVGLSLAALAGVGRTKTLHFFPVMIGFYVLFAVLGLREGDQHRGTPSVGRGRELWRIFVATAFAGAVGAGTALALPPLHALVIDRITASFRDRTGFSTSMTLSSLDGLFQSDRVVLRIRGKQTPEYLRGAVFSKYSNGSWDAPEEVGSNSLRQTSIDPPSSGEAGAVELEFPQRPQRYFLPLDAADVRVSSGEYYENELGIRSPVLEKWAKRVWFDDGTPPRMAPPSVSDHELYKPVYPVLGQLLADWGIDRTMPAAERIERIKRRLETDYEYSTQFERSPDVDPVIDFLITHKRGHCEYFASALTLLARKAGVQARVVNGFHVSERSTLADYAIVRDRDAHAWSEVFLDDHWVTVDATPPAHFGSAPPTSWLSSMSDLLGTSWERFDDFLGARSPFELTLALVGLIGLLFLVRFLRTRNRSEKREEAQVDLPLPAFVRLEKGLSALGMPRAPDETLEAYASRLDARPEAVAVRAYAALRYGGVGVQAEVIEVLERASALLESSLPRRV